MAWQGYFDELDDETVAAIVQLQREDVESLANEKGKQREGDLSDGDLALELCMEELNLYEASGLGQQAYEDHELPSHLQDTSSDLTSELDQSSPSSEGDTWSEDIRERLEARHFTDMLVSRNQKGEPDQPGAESSKSAAERIFPPIDQYYCCVICSDEQPWYELAKAPCGDEYCTDCISSLFESSMTDESLYPPRCCGEKILMESAKPFLKPGLATSFVEKSVELDTKDRTYCWEPLCSTFIPPGPIPEDVVTCPECSRTTCVACKTAAHRGDCPNDTPLQQLLATAEDEGWQRCYQCFRIVELDIGCNHITCRCGAQFCYVCGEPWKRCGCDQWNEGRLYARAARLADREREPEHRLYQPWGDPIAAEGEEDENDEEQEEEENEEEPPVSQTHIAAQGDAFPLLQALLLEDRIGRIARRLRDNHECLHRRWRRVAGPHNCEECHFPLPKFIFECRQCQLQACRRCRKNRL